MRILTVGIVGVSTMLAVGVITAATVKGVTSRKEEPRTETQAAQGDARGISVLAEMHIEGKQNTLRVICDYHRGNILYLAWGNAPGLPPNITVAHSPVIAGISPCDGSR